METKERRTKIKHKKHRYRIETNRSEITEADKKFIKENYGVILSHEIPVKLGLQRRVYFAYIKKAGLKNNRQKRVKDDKPEYYFTWSRNWPF